jgi:hypothetical protein
VLVQSVDLGVIGKYFLSGTPIGGGYSTYRLYIHNGGNTYTDIGAGKACTLTDGVSTIGIAIASGSTVDITIKPMLNVGTVAFPYMPYRESVVYNSSVDGMVSGIKSVSPRMVLVADTESIGISVDYHKSYGMQTEYDRFWDTYQRNGNRRNYSRSFLGEGWTSDNFKPKYPIIANGDASYMFDSAYIGNINSADFDFVEKGIEFDVAGATSLTYIFRNAQGIKRIGVIDARGCANLNRLFYQSGIETVDVLCVTDAAVYDATFSSATKLKNITFDGTIGKSISFTNCPLTPTSMKNIIDHLKSYVAGPNDGVYTITFSESCWEALEADSPSPLGGDYTWKDYVIGILGWQV